MSIKVITAVLDLSPAAVTPPERLVLVGLAWHADEHGRNAWPAVSTLARKTSLTRRGVQRILHTLKRKGFVYVESLKARRSVIYALDMAALNCDRYSQSKPSHRDPESQSAQDDCDPESPSCDPESPSLRIGFAPPATQGRPIRPLTVLEPSVKKSLPLRGNSPAEKDNDKGDEEPEAANYQGDRVILKRLELLAHESFNHLGDYATFDALAADFRERTRDLNLDIEPDIGQLLFSVKKERRARRAAAGSNGKGWH